MLDAPDKKAELSALFLIHILLSCEERDCKRSVKPVSAVLSGVLHSITGKIKPYF